MTWPADFVNDSKHPYKVGDPCWIFVDVVHARAEAAKAGKAA